MGDKKKNVKEQYDEVEIDGIKCKRFLVSYGFSKGDYSVENYSFGYLVPHDKTYALYILDGAKTHPTSFEKDVATLDEAFEYMIKTAEYREFKRKK